MWSAISGIVTGLVSPITTLFARKAELSEAQHVADLAAVKAQGDRQVTLISQGLAADANWEIESLRAGSGWARNAELIVVSIPMVICFTRFSSVVKDGFAALSGTPGWYQTILVTIYLANYGIRLWRRQQSDT
jgi:hypothetical protein